MIFVSISFVAGILTILAPCTLPLLPVIIGSSVSGEEQSQNKIKAFTIAISLGLSIIVFTLLLKFSTFFISVPQEVWQIISGSIIILFGLVSIFPGLWENIPLVNRLSISSNKAMSAGYKKQSFLGDIIIGASLGPVFSTCSPTYFIILATVLPQSFAHGLLDLIVYAIGLSGSLLIIAFLGQKIVGKLGGFSDNNGLFKKIIGILFILLGLFIIFGVDKNIETSLSNSGVFDVTKLEDKLLALTPQTSVTSSVPVTATTTTAKENTANPEAADREYGPLAPEITDPSGFINTDNLPITLAQYKGKDIVLLDIWTYSCINCQREIPYVESWYNTYKGDGFVVIGIHTPEFAFEKVMANVEAAVQKAGITYPVVLDNNYGTWNAYGNEYWPRKYLINEYGEIIYDQTGEGGYSDMEAQIQKALSELNGKPITGDATDTVVPVTIEAGSPETYFGSNRNEYFGNGTPMQAGQGTFTLPATSSIEPNTFYLGGAWNITSEYAESAGTVAMPSTLEYMYQAKGVYFVAGADTTPVDVQVLMDGAAIPQNIAGADIFYKNGMSYVTISGNRLYKIIDDSSQNTHTLEFFAPAGLQAFTFTFG